MHEEEDEEEEEDEGDMDEYTDEIQIPVEMGLFRKARRRYDSLPDRNGHLVNRDMERGILSFKNSLPLIINSLNIMHCHRDEQEDFDNLLEDISTIDHHHHSIAFSDKLNLNERERTREESY